MQLVLTVLTGPDEGRTVTIEPGQTLTIGRRTQADEVLTADPYMSGLHFTVKWEGDKCVIEDLKSTVGTFLQGEKIDRAILTDGCQFRAGKTEFSVRLGAGDVVDKPPTVDPFSSIGFTVEGESAFGNLPTPPSMFSGSAVDSTPPDSAVADDWDDAELAAAGNTELPAPVLIAFEGDECENGLVVFRGRDRSPKPSWFIRQFSQIASAYLVVDFVKMEEPFPKEVENRDYLFNWFTEEELAECSPIILDESDGVDLCALADELWDREGVFCVFSSLDKPALVKHLRAVARGDDGESTDPPKGLFGYFWPVAARPVLAHGKPKQVGRLMEKVDVVLVEGEDPGSWEAFCKTDTADQLEELLGGADAPEPTAQPTRDSGNG